MKATSWGRFQILGENFRHAGYDNVESFVEDMHKTEGHHLRAFVRSLQSTGIHIHLKNHNWATFARLYNGRESCGDPHVRSRRGDAVIPRIARQGAGQGLLRRRGTGCPSRRGRSSDGRSQTSHGA